MCVYTSYCYLKESQINYIPLATSTLGSHIVVSYIIQKQKEQAPTGENGWWYDWGRKYRHEPIASSHSKTNEMPWRKAKPSTAVGWLSQRDMKTNWKSYPWLTLELPKQKINKL